MWGKQYKELLAPTSDELKDSFFQEDSTCREVSTLGWHPYYWKSNTRILGAILSSVKTTSLYEVSLQKESRKVQPTASLPLEGGLGDKNIYEKGVEIVSLAKLIHWLPTDKFGFLGGASGKECACQCRRRRDLGSILGLGRSSGEGSGNPVQNPCLENAIDRGAWWATALGVARVRHDIETKPPTEGNGPAVEFWDKIIFSQIRSLRELETLTRVGYWPHWGFFTNIHRNKQAISGIFNSNLFNNQKLWTKTCSIP